MCTAGGNLVRNAKISRSSEQKQKEIEIICEIEIRGVCVRTDFLAAFVLKSLEFLPLNSRIKQPVQIRIHQQHHQQHRLLIFADSFMCVYPLLFVD